MLRFNAPTATTGNVFSFDWAPKSVQFTGSNGQAFEVTGAGVPETDDETVRINLYWDQGVSGNVAQEMVITGFEFTPSTRIDVPSFSNTVVPARGLHVPALAVALPQPWEFKGVPSYMRVVRHGATADVLVRPNWSTWFRIYNLGYVDAGSTGTRWALLQEPAVGTVEQRTIGKLYTNLLGRVPADDERDFHLVKALHQGVSVGQLATGFFTTPEFQETGRFAAGLYVGLLCRDPEYAGWLLQRSVLSSDASTQRNLVAAFLSTPEANLLYGSATNADFVKTLYRCALGRLPSDFEVQNQVNLITSGLSRVDFAYSILKSQEFQVGASRRITDVLLYAGLLNRDASELEKSWWVDALKTMPLQEAVHRFVNSEEFALGLQ